MHFLVLFFLILQFFYLINNRALYYLLQKFTAILKDKQEHPEQTKIILIDSSSFVFLVYMAGDFLYLLFCLWLLFTEKYWQPGAMLFLLTSLETYAFHMRVDYTFDEAENGYLYPKTWLRCSFSGLSIYILTRLYFIL